MTKHAPLTFILFVSLSIFGCATGQSSSGVVQTCTEYEHNEESEASFWYGFDAGYPAYELLQKNLLPPTHQPNKTFVLMGALLRELHNPKMGLRDLLSDLQRMSVIMFLSQTEIDRVNKTLNDPNETPAERAQIVKLLFGGYDRGVCFLQHMQRTHADRMQIPQSEVNKK